MKKNPADVYSEKYEKVTDLHKIGELDGKKAALSDFLTNKIDLNIFTEENRDYKDPYQLSFELGYLRKLAELLVEGDSYDDIQVKTKRK